MNQSRPHISFLVLLFLIVLPGFSSLRLYWQTRTHCCGHIVADTYVSPFARARNICCGHKFCVRDTKKVSDFVQKHFVSATNVSQFARARKHHEQQCVRNNVSSFASTFSIALRIPTAHDFRVISAHERVHVQNLRDFRQTKFENGINSPFLLSEHGDLRFFFTRIC